MQNKERATSLAMTLALLSTSIQATSQGRPLTAQVTAPSGQDLKLQTPKRSDSRTSLAASDGKADVPVQQPPREGIHPDSGGASGHPYRPGVDEDFPALPFPPLDQIAPLKFQAKHTPEPLVQNLGVYIHDATTRTTWAPADVPASDGLFTLDDDGEFTGMGLGDTFEENTYGFGSMSPAGSLDSYPRSANVKLIMEFEDVDGDSHFAEASGSMQDAGVVLTAGHCLYHHGDFPETNDRIDDYAKRVWVIPGWDGNGFTFSSTPSSSQILQNWGYIESTRFMVAQEWADSESPGRDVGALRITRGISRNVGMITGWYAIASGGSCSDVKDNTYHNFSYPGASCHDGTTMMYWNGVFDSCPTLHSNCLSIDVPGTCMESTWGGMSGSGAYYHINGQRYMHGVHSHSLTGAFSGLPYRGHYVQLWGEFVSNLQAFEAEARSNDEDWEPLMFRVQGYSGLPWVPAGSLMLDGCTVQMCNATNADPEEQDYVVRVYFSDNNRIETSDTLLATYSYLNYDFDAMDKVQFNIPALSIPSNTPTGTYYLGVVIDSGLPGTQGNDSSSRWDAAPIFVIQNPVPNDLCVDAIDLNPEDFMVAFDTTQATPDPQVSCAPEARGVWFKMTALHDGPHYANTCLGESYDTYLQVFSGSCEALSSVACNDDACDLQSSVEWIAEAGTTYLIHVSGYGSSAGTGWLEVGRDRLPNDESWGALTLVPDVPQDFDTTFAVDEGVLGAPCTPSTPIDLWFRHYATQDGELQVDTCGFPGFDTVLEVRESTSTSSILVACNDDTCGPLSMVRWQASAGKHYLFRVYGYLSHTGLGQIRLTELGPFSLFCDPAETNSSGTSVSLEDSTYMGPEAFHLEASGGPPNNFALFLFAANSKDPGTAVADGFLCLQGAIGRFSKAGTSAQSLGQFDSAGVLQNISGTSSVGSGFDVPFELPNGMGSILEGSEWCFQLWYRDGQSSNFSDGIRVPF